MAQYIEILFRYWLRFALILIVLPVPVSAATLIYFREVQATSNLWVQDPYFGSNVSSNSVPGWNQYLTPAQNVTDELDQYLQTKSFLDGIRDNLAQTGVADSTTRKDLVNAIPKNLHVVASGSHLVTLTFSCNHSAYCTTVLSAAIAVFRDRLTSALKAQEQLSTSLFQSQLAAAQQRYDQSRGELETYLADHPGKAASSVELDSLTTREQQDRDQVIQLQNDLTRAQYTYEGADQFIKTSTQIVDPPRVAQGGVIGDGSSLKKAAVVWLAAIGIAAGYLALLVWMDKSARDSKELVSRLSVPMLATVPLLTAKETH